MQCGGGVSYGRCIQLQGAKKSPAELGFHMKIEIDYLVRSSLIRAAFPICVRR